MRSRRASIPGAGSSPGRWCVRSSLRPLYLRQLRHVELAHPLPPEIFELLQARCALTDEAPHVDAQRLGLELPQAFDPVSQHPCGAAPVAVLEVVEADADLEDALVEEAYPARLLHPGLFEVLVALVELAPVELLDALQGEVRQTFRRLRLVFGQPAASRSRSPRRSSHHPRRPPYGRPSRGSSRARRPPGLWRRSWR